MLPKNVLRDRRLERLRIFTGPDAGPLADNVLKRWEDGTLAPRTDAPAPAFRRAPGFPRGDPRLAAWWADVQQRGWAVENPPRVWKKTREAVDRRLAAQTKAQSDVAAGAPDMAALSVEETAAPTSTPPAP
jgi:hypothetical protein